MRRARLRADAAAGPQAAFISAGGYHHHIGLNTWESRGGPPPPDGTTGLYHLAILYPTRAALADALRRLIEANIPLEGASDHGVSEALYLRDPDDNGVELYWDRPQELWPRTADGKLAMFTRQLDLMGFSPMPHAAVRKGAAAVQDRGLIDRSRIALLPSAIMDRLTNLPAIGWNDLASAQIAGQRSRAQ